MNSIFDTIVIIFISLTIFICLILFSEDVVIRQDTTYLKTKICEIIEIESGYTEEAKEKIDEILASLNYETILEVSKIGRLEYGEELTFTITVINERKLPFIGSETETIQYSSIGSYYNINF